MPYWLAEVKKKKASYPEALLMGKWQWRGPLGKEAWCPGQGKEEPEKDSRETRER